MNYKRLLNLIPLTLFPAMLIWINIKLAQTKAPDEVVRILTYKNGDKFSHVIVYGILTFVVLFFGDGLFALKKHRVALRIILASLLFILITAEEFTQRELTARSFSYTDLACSYIGFSFALGFFVLVKNVGELIRLREKK